ncbi:hypothetical protein [Rhodobacter flavimaris]|nr:hypothetical protein [Sinirhodobacter sp. WL0062]
MNEALDAFLRDQRISRAEFFRWHGACSFLLGIQVSRRPETNRQRSVFAHLLDEFSLPSQTWVALERGQISKNDIDAKVLEGLPAGTAVRRWLSSGIDFDTERLYRMAAVTGLTWQLAYLYAFLCHHGPDSPKYSPAPVATDGALWSAAPAWIDAVAAFETRFHGEPRGSRGPKSKASPIAAMLAKARAPDLDQDSMKRKIRKLDKGKRPLTYFDVTEIWSLMGQASNIEEVEDDWQTTHFQLGVQGHFAGFMGYLERAWAQAAERYDQPEMLSDLHEVWQDWPLLLEDAIACQHRILTRHAL